MIFLKEGIRISIISILVNTVLSIFKFISGIIGNSSAMISDSIHSFSDVLTTVVVIIGLKLSSKENNKKHPYGHERIECITAIILSFFLALTGISIGYVGINNIIFKEYLNNPTPTFLPLIAALVSIIIKEAMFQCTKKVAKKINSDSLMADAWHHRSDALSSIGSLIGISGAMIGFRFLDSITSIIICLCIIKVSFDIFIDSVNKIIDKSCDDEFIERIKTLILEVDGVKGIDSIKTRIFGNKVYIDIEVSADSNLTLDESHQIAHKIHDYIELKFKEVKHCMVHMNPKV